MNMDPVCGMEVKPETARYTKYHEQDWFFCSEKCQHKFEDNPQQYTVDPVCQMFVKPTSTHRVKHADTTYRFCSEKCVSKFSATPKTYLDKHESCEHQTSSKVEHVSGSGKYTCPMHPEVVSDKPGSCPKCGMALEPRTVSAEDDNTELNDMSRRFKVSAVLSIPVFILAMVADLAPSWLPAGLHMSTVQWIEFVLATPVVLWGGWPFFVRFVASVRTWNLNMFTLIGLGVGVAWLYSIVALFMPSLFPLIMQMEGGLVDVYFEAAAVITTLVLLGQVLELRARSRTNEAIKLLLGMAPKTARLVKDDGAEVDVLMEDVQVGDVLRIRPGEKVPVDGVVTEGESLVMNPW